MFRVPRLQKEEWSSRISTDQGYPSGLFSEVGQHLQALTTNGRLHTTPVRVPSRTPIIECIVVPTVRSVNKNRKNIERILRLADNHGAKLVLFLCSGKAKRTDVAKIAANFDQLSWLAIDGPFLTDPLIEFKTSQSFIAYGAERDLAQKRNFALLLARLMGWKNLFLLDDDLAIADYDLAKTADLLQADTLAVGFSARDFPDLSTVVHAGKWARLHVDCFVGGGALAIKTDSPKLPFFPHIYNEDWLFLLPYCLLDGAVTWAGTVKQQRYNPFRDPERAIWEEPGDLLAEGLVRLATKIKSDPTHPHDFDSILKTINKLTDKLFWEREINDRILFFGSIRDYVGLKRFMPGRAKSIYKSLAVSLATLHGQNGFKGMSASTLAQWTQAWVRDIKSWHRLLANLPTCYSIEEAMGYLEISNAYIASGVKQQSSQPFYAKSSMTHMPVELEGMPIIPRTPQRLKGLRTTRLIEQFHHNKGLTMKEVIKSAAKLRFDRPVKRGGQRPDLTIGMLVANGESYAKISQSIGECIKWLNDYTNIQIILWVYDLPEAKRSHKLSTYRDGLVAHIIPEILNTNIRLRSVPLVAQTGNIDHLIDDMLAGTAMAYWLENIEGDRRIYVVNSHNELLRQGTLWDFVQHQHDIPTRTLEECLKQHRFSTAEVVEDRLIKDDEALAESRSGLVRRSNKWKELFGYSSTGSLIRSMHKFRLSWVELDDIAYELTFHDGPITSWRQLPPTAYCMPIQFDHKITANHAAKKIVQFLAPRIAKKNNFECMIAIYSSQKNQQWEQMLAFRAELMDIVLELCDRKDIIFASLVCHPERAGTLDRTKSITEAATRYIHWMLNHKQKVSIKFIGP